MKIIGPMIALLALVYFVWLAAYSQNYVKRGGMASNAQVGAFIMAQLAAYKRPTLKERQAKALQELYGEAVAMPVELYK